MSDLDLTGQILLSTPSMDDPRFARSVIYLVAHSREGSYGLMVNRPLRDVVMGDVLGQLGITGAPGPLSRSVFGGGPVEMHRGFVLHSDDWSDGEAPAPCKGGLSISASLEALTAVAMGEGPKNWLLALGYVGWGPGQLEAEIAQNCWMNSEIDADFVFEPEHGDRCWSRALRKLGIDPLQLSAAAGRA